MRLDFRILWIDDQPRHVESFAEGIARKLKDSGFNLQKLTAESVEAVEDVSADHIHDDCIDLVLVDYDLGDGKGGELALTKVREIFPYKDIIFYSAIDTEHLRKIAYEEKIDGVFFSNRMSLVDDTIKLIESLLHKNLDLDHMRGIVMAATSDIDYMVEESIKGVFARFDNDGKIVFLKKILGRAQKKLDKFSREVEKLKVKEDLESFVKLRHIYTAHDKLLILLEELDTWADNSGSVYLEKVKEYQSEVVPRRNKLAHSMLKIKDGKQSFVGMEQPPTTESMKILRCDLINHRSNIEHIAVLVDANLD